VAGVEWSNVHLAGAFLVGAAFATVATLRIVKAVTSFFAGVDRSNNAGKRDARGDD
jgi:hypothetical protein